MSSRKSRSPSKRRSSSPSKRRSRSPSKRRSKSPTKRKSRSPSPTRTKDVFFEVWFKQKPSVNNNIETFGMKLRLDEDNEWLLTGMTKNYYIYEVKKWVRSLGRTCKIQVGY